MVTLSSDSRPIIARGPAVGAGWFFLGAVASGSMVLDHRQKYLDVAGDWLSRGVDP